MQVSSQAIEHNNRGIDLANAGKYDEAIAEYTKAIAIDPKYANAYANRGIAYNNKKQYDMAIIDLSKAIELDTKNADAWNNKGVALQKLGRPAEAIEYYNGALQIDPSHEYAKSNKASLMASAGGSFSISLKTTPALPLTPLNITIVGIYPEASMTVTFSNSSGYSVTKKVLRANQDGTILVGVPLYINPKTHKITEGKVNVVVSQHLSDGPQGQRSAPVAFTIEDLPSLKGIPPGKITRSFFTASALLSQRYITALQFYENASNGKIDTTAARNSETNILKAIISGRNDIDSIISDPTRVINVGTAADGTPLQFTRDSLDI
ncbi:MAG: tetratricopeptide repeat protein, partial [Dehalococcoidia bacterium]|nr:tetratricopeptide repeat protein [Dehalococcoidia bacterium]